jgi:hypothetical protein
MQMGMGVMTIKRGVREMVMQQQLGRVVTGKRSGQRGCSCALGVAQRAASGTTHGLVLLLLLAVLQGVLSHQMRKGEGQQQQQVVMMMCEGQQSSRQRLRLHGRSLSSSRSRTAAAATMMSHRRMTVTARGQTVGGVCGEPTLSARRCCLQEVDVSDVVW